LPKIQDAHRRLSEFMQPNSVHRLAS
jgi:hypothetical protein